MYWRERKNLIHSTLFVVTLSLFWFVWGLRCTEDMWMTLVTLIMPGWRQRLWTIMMKLVGISTCARLCLLLYMLVWSWDVCWAEVGNEIGGACKSGVKYWAKTNGRGGLLSPKMFSCDRQLFPVVDSLVSVGLEIKNIWTLAANYLFIC